MSKSYLLKFSGEEYEVTIDSSDSVYKIKLGEHEHHFEILLDKNPIYTFLVDGKEIIDVESNLNKDKCELNLASVPYTIKVLDPLQAAADEMSGSSGGSGTIESPMSGKVIDIKIGEGDEVQSGQVAIIIEAMKMQNEITVPINGKVKAVHVAAGDSVETDQKLIEIE